MLVARRLLVLLPPLLLLVGAPAARARAPSPPAPRPLRVVFLDALQPENPWRRELVGAMRAAANDLGIDFVDHAVGHWPGEILEQARQVLSGPGKPDYLLVTLHRGTGPGLLEEAERADVPVFVINTGLLPEDRARYGGPRQHFAHWLGQMQPDDVEAGRQLAVLLLEAARARARAPDAPVRLVALEGRRGDGSALLREEGLRQALAGSRHAELLQSVSASWREDVARRKTFLLRRRYPELQAVWAANDRMALGALKGLEDAGAGGQVVVGGIDWTPEALEAVRDGRMVASLGGHFLEGAWALVLLYDYHQGHDFASERLEWRTRLLPLTRDTVDAWLRLHLGMDWEAFDFRAFSKAAHPGLARYDFSLQALLAQHGASLPGSLRDSNGHARPSPPRP
ncbi:ABC transporter substrate-binding protein [Archangium sp.]|uniref:ABC transporter substrate-binding protein n=1 Tax=Archangium sp. TaxID=1872627 RepID=UPI003899B2D9